MNKIIPILLMLLLLCISCSETSSEQDINTQQSEPATTNYVNFALNTHDWVFPEKSADAVLRTIAIHEKYNVPLDVYVDDQVFQIFVNEYPEIITQLKTSSVVTVSYHSRPPTPTYYQFDLFNFSTKSEQELYPLLLEYEEHAINLSTGLLEEKAGGYQFVKDTIGYAPVTVSLLQNTEAEKRVMVKIYTEKGARLGIIHGRVIQKGQRLYGMLLRPEDVEIKWYEQLRRYMAGKVTAESFLTAEVQQAGGGPGLFLNLKMHENNFYTSGTPFALVYYADEDKEIPLSPPFDISQGVKTAQFKSAEENTALWQWYEDGVAYVAAHPELYTAVSTKDIAEMIQ